MPGVVAAAEEVVFPAADVIPWVSLLVASVLRGPCGLSALRGADVEALRPELLEAGGGASGS